MGLFDLFKKKPAAGNIQKYFPDHDAQQESLKYQSELLGKVNAANAQYAEDGNIDALIKVYEFAFIESTPPCKSSQNLKLVDLYLKTGQNNKAWHFLNSLITSQEAPIEKIRHEQARILKKEKRYVYALEMTMYEHLHKYEWNNTFHRDAFIKDAGVCIRALKWEDISDVLADMIEKQVAKHNYDDLSLRESYYDFLKTKKLFEEDNNGKS